MPVWWVTGATGFLGRHVLAQLAGRFEESKAAGAEAAGFRLVGLVRTEPGPEAVPDGAEIVRLDLADRDALRSAAERIPPDFVIHCAGRTSPATEDELQRANLGTTADLLDGLRRSSRPIRLVLAGSAAELGPVAAAELPVGEDHPCRPVDAYGRTKWESAQTVLRESTPFEPVVARLFNLIGPGLSTNQAFGRFARRLLCAESDPITLRVGDLDARRDFIDVRDAARAMIALALQGAPRTVYHVGTGRSRRIGDGLDELIRLSGRAVRLEIDPALGNPKGPSDSRADVRRIQNQTDWRPTVSWETSLRDLWIDAESAAGRAPQSGAHGLRPRPSS